MGNSNKINQFNVLSRRHFIAQTALASGALVFPGFLSSFTSTSKDSGEIIGIIKKKRLSEGWQIKSFPGNSIFDRLDLSGVKQDTDNTEWFSVPTMPAMPHKILLHHKEIEEPWKPFGMEKCYWVSQKDWVYVLNLKSDDLKTESRLVFKELKGEVDVYLNGAVIASNSDQAHPLVVDVTGKLKNDNQLVLHFKKAAPDEKPDQPDPAVRNNNGTYLGPNPMLYTAGVIGEIILEYTDGNLINEIITDFSLNDALTIGEVKFVVSGKSRWKNVDLQIRLVETDGNQVAEANVSGKVHEGSFSTQHFRYQILHFGGLGATELKICTKPKLLYWLTERSIKRKTEPLVLEKLPCRRTCILR